jgi:hypothetical protein
VFNRWQAGVKWLGRKWAYLAGKRPRKGAEFVYILCVFCPLGLQLGLQLGLLFLRENDPIVAKTSTKTPVFFENQPL